MNQTCGEHSGVCQRFSSMEKIVDDLKKELHEQKGYNSGMFSLANQEIREVNQKLRDEMKEIKREIQAEMKSQLNDLKNELTTGINDIKSSLENTDTKKENKFNMYLTSGIFPTIVILVGFVIEHYFGK